MKILITKVEFAITKIEFACLALKQLNTLSTIHHHLSAVDKTSLITGQIQAHVGDIIHVGEAAQWHISDELLSVLGGIFHTGEH